VAVTVAPGVEEMLQQHGMPLIRSAEEPSRVAAAVAAAAHDIAGTGLLRRTGETVIAGEVIRSDGTRWRPADQEWEDNEQLWSLDGPASVLGPVPVPGGQLLIIDYKDTPPELCQETPRLLIRRLEAAGVRDAEISLAPQLSGDRFAALRSFSPVVRAYLRTGDPPPAGRFTGMPSAPRLIGVAAEWLRSHYAPGSDLLALVNSTIPVSLTWDSLKPVAEDVLAADVSVDLIVSDFATRATTAQLGFFGYTGITLAAAGRDWRSEQAAAQMRALRETIRTCAADAEWAGVDVYPSTERAHYIPGDGDVLGNIRVYHRDELHVGPMWYQVISDAELRRLGAPPPGAAELADGRFELTAGEPEQWVPGHPDNAAVRARAGKLLPRQPDPGPTRPRRRGFWRGPS
jgi:hypothetical protein